ncbi:hypothetical protein MPDQ_008003 [Monascus purpureus]|uniref:Uncharacterized protein n=1 Tax=Monascus purpureus TaxID=5098 RepID=A0A507QUB1_MONPU|nr:hypothetical protein MPDQ_008003 [Monascus purpureus]
MAESCDLGPYLVLSFEEGTLLSEFLKGSSEPTAPMVLHPDIDTAILSKAYRNMAKVLIELSKCKFSHIGAVDNGQFWFCLAATSSFGFDDIYWKFIDPVHYGEFTAIEDRIGLLIQQEQDDLKPFVQLKMQQREDADLEEHRTFNEMFYA